MKRRIPFALLMLPGACARSTLTPDLGPTEELAAEVMAATRALDTSRHQWRRIESPRATIYVAPTVPERSAAPFADSIESAISAHLAWLGASPPAGAPKLRLFLVRSRDEIELITGARAPGWAEPASRSAFFVVTDSVRIGLRHEVMHILSWRHWGTPSSFWMSEGLATWSVPSCGGVPIHDAVAMMDRAGLLLPLETIRTRFTVSGDSGLVAYLQSADLVRFIDARYGRDRFRAMWSHGGLADVRRTLGIDLATLEREWRASLAAADVKAWPGMPAFRASINALGCS